MNKIISYLPSFLIFFGAICAAIGGLWTTLRDTNDKKEFEQKLNSKNEKIIELNDEIKKYTVGGDNYPFIQEYIEKDKCHFSIFNNSPNMLPLYDVNVLLINHDLKKKIDDDKSIPLVNKMYLLEREAFKRIYVGYLPGISGLAHIDTVALPPKEKEIRYEIHMTARNTSVVQDVIIYYDNEYKRYHTKSKLIKDGIELFNTIKPKQTINPTRR